MDAYRWFLLAHVAAGTVALATFWANALMRKGTPLHRRIGRIYLLAMLVVLASGVPLVLALFARGREWTALFLGYILLITGNACWSAWRAIRDRNDRARYYGTTYWVQAAAIGLAGLGIVVAGFSGGVLLMQVFGAVGVFAFFDAVASYRRAPRDPKWWLREHYGAMVGNGIATHIAFFGIGLRNALPGLDPVIAQNVAWLLPLAVGIGAAVWLDRRYGRPRAPGKTAATGSDAVA